MNEQKIARRPERKAGAAAEAGGTLSGLLAEPRRRKILEWLQEENQPDAMAMAVVFGVPRAIRRQVEQIVREEAADSVWTVQVRGAGDVLAGLGRERVDMPAIDLQQLFALFLETELARGTHDPAFSARLAEIGLAELKAAQALVAAEIGNEDT